MHRCWYQKARWVHENYSFTPFRIFSLNSFDEWPRNYLVHTKRGGWRRGAGPDYNLVFWNPKEWGLNGGLSEWNSKNDVVINLHDFTTTQQSQRTSFWFFEGRASKLVLQHGWIRGVINAGRICIRSTTEEERLKGLALIHRDFLIDTVNQHYLILLVLCDFISPASVLKAWMVLSKSHSGFHHRARPPLWTLWSPTGAGEPLAQGNL